MEPWPADSTKRSRSGHCGALGSNFRDLPNNTVATSAMPIGMPGCPDFAASTASMARARIALAIKGWAAPAFASEAERDDIANLSRKYGQATGQPWQLRAAAVKARTMQS